MMRLLTILTVVCALLWGGWWIVGSLLVKTGVDRAVASARDDGWRIDYSDLSVAGFPNRFDVTASDLTLGDPSGLWQMALPFLQVFALSYRPNHIIVVPADEGTVTTPFDQIALTAEDARASAQVSLTGGAGLSTATVVAQTLTAEGGAWQASLASGQFALREAEGIDGYDVALGLVDLAFAGAGLDPNLPQAFEAIDLDVTVELDRLAAQQGLPVKADLRRAALDWGAASVSVAGEATVGPSGLLNGALTMQMRNPDAILDLARTLGLPPTSAALLSGGLAELTENDVARVPLTLREGRLLFGAIPLATLPRLPVR